MSTAMARVTIWVLTGLLGLLPIAGYAQTTIKYVHTDALGSVVAVTNASGAVVETGREYEPYGLQLAPAIQDGPGYTGHVQDAATGLTYMQQRYYDPMLGVFLSADPVTAYEQPINQFHRYRYANNNPYKFTDPNGRAAICLVPGPMQVCMAAGAAVVKGVVWVGGAVAAAWAGSKLYNEVVNESAEPKPSDSGNTNPYDGPVDAPVIVVDGDGNAIPVGEGEQVSSSPDGKYQQVKDRSGQPTGTRLDKGGHRGHADPKAQAPHGHRPGVTDETGNPHLPIEPPKPPPEDPSRGL